MMGGCPPPCPIADPAPADGRLPASVLERRGGPRVRRLRPRAVLRVRCGYCDFNTYTADRAAAARRRSDVRRAASRRSRWRGACSATRGCRPGRRHRLLRRRHADPAADRGPARDPRRGRREFGLAAGAEVTTEANPDSVDAETCAPSRDAGFTRVSLRHAVRRAARAARRSTARTTRSGCRCRRLGAGRRASTVSLDLIYGTPGESPRRLATQPRRRAGAGARPPLGVLADRRAGHRARAPHPLGRAARCRTTTSWPTSTCWPTTASARRATSGTR